VNFLIPLVLFCHFVLFSYSTESCLSFYCAIWELLHCWNSPQTRLRWCFAWPNNSIFCFWILKMYSTHPIPGRSLILHKQSWILWWLNDIINTMIILVMITCCNVIQITILLSTNVVLTVIQMTTHCQSFLLIKKGYRCLCVYIWRQFLHFIFSSLSQT